MAQLVKRSLFVVIVCIGLIHTTIAKEKVIVVGAGLSGLISAKNLMQEGYEVVVLEARDRIGGRVWTDRSTGTNVDLGASWIHGIDGNPIKALADQINTPLTGLTDYDSTSTFDFNGVEDPVNDSLIDGFQDIYDQYADPHIENGDDISVQAVIDEAVTIGAYNGLSTRIIDSIVNTTFEHELAGDASELAIAGVAEGEDISGGDVLFEEGYDKITDFLATGLDIRLESVVKTISYGESGVVVNTSQDEFKGDRVIVTVPLGVLKAGDITFNPALPEEKLSAISRLGFGVLNKVWLGFPSVFWDNTDIHNYFSEPKGHFNEWVNWHKASGNNYLLGFNAASYGVEIESKTDEEIVAEAMSILRLMWGEDIPDPTSHVITRWKSDPYAKGSYSFIKVGSVSADRVTLAASVSDRVFFAGEATDTAHSATTNGAYDSGIREAAKIVAIGNLDPDGDGVRNFDDAFPNDSTEQLDTDGDGLGNNADADDDNDGMPDTFEIGGLDPLTNDADVDTDGDGVTNLWEFETNTDPNDATSFDACFSTSAVAIDASASLLSTETRLYFANPGSNLRQQTFLRFVNPNNATTSVEVYGIDDGGNLSKKEPFSFTLAANAAIQINAQDVENGNSDKGITSNLCDGRGKWQYRIRSDNAIKVMGLIRTPDGFLTSLDDVVPKSGNDNIIYFANPASNTNQQTFLRIVNTSSSSGTVTITGVDDAGVTSTGTVSFSLGAYEAKQLTAQDLENGNSNKGFTGNLDNGSGKWRLTVSSSLALEVMSLIRTPDGFLTNLSGMVDKNTSGDHVIYFANPASEVVKTTFLRIINTSSEAGTVTISGIDDSGNTAPGGDVMFDLGANESKQMVVKDLEEGNLNKGLLGMIGDGEGRWRLTVSSTLSLQVMSLVRTPDGFLTNLSRTTPVTNNVNDVYIFNPGSNSNQRSSLRIVNDSSQQGNATISAFDDTGAASPGGNVTFNIAADSAMLLTAQDLENGNSDLGLVGALGDGSGKWRLQVTSDVALQVQSLLDTPTGFLTNLSRASE